MQTKIAPSVSHKNPVVIGFACDAAATTQDVGAQVAVTLPATGFAAMMPVAPGISNFITVPTGSLTPAARIVIAVDFMDTGSGTLTIDQQGARVYSDASSEDIVYLSMVV